MEPHCTCARRRRVPLDFGIAIVRLRGANRRRAWARCRPPLRDVASRSAPKMPSDELDGELQHYFPKIARPNHRASMSQRWPVPKHSRGLFAVRAKFDPHALALTRIAQTRRLLAEPPRSCDSAPSATRARRGQRSHCDEMFPRRAVADCDCKESEGEGESELNKCQKRKHATTGSRSTRTITRQAATTRATM